MSISHMDCVRYDIDVFHTKYSHNVNIPSGVHDGNIPSSAPDGNILSDVPDGNIPSDVYIHETCQLSRHNWEHSIRYVHIPLGQNLNKGI